MDKLTKFLHRLTPKERAGVEASIVCILSRKTEGFDIKKLRGQTDVFRLRIGSIRVIYQQDAADTHLLYIGRRNDTTYRDL